MDGKVALGCRGKTLSKYFIGAIWVNAIISEHSEFSESSEDLLMNIDILLHTQEGMERRIPRGTLIIYWEPLWKL